MEVAFQCNKYKHQINCLEHTLDRQTLLGELITDKPDKTVQFGQQTV